MVVWNVLEIIQSNGPIFWMCIEDRHVGDNVFCPYVSMWAWGKKEQVAGFDLGFDLPWKVICNIYYSPA